MHVIIDVTFTFYINTIHNKDYLEETRFVIIEIAMKIYMAITMATVVASHVHAFIIIN